MDLDVGYGSFYVVGWLFGEGLGLGDFGVVVVVFGDGVEFGE